MADRAGDRPAEVMSLLACLALGALILAVAWWKGWPLWFLG